MFSSGVDSIALTAPSWHTVHVGDTFSIIDPSVQIDVPHAPVFSLVGDGAPGRYIVQFVLANLDFNTDMSIADPDAWHPYSYNGNCDATFGLTRFAGWTPAITVWTQRAGIINMFPVELCQFPLLEDDTLIQNDTYEASGAVQIIGSVVPPVSAAGWMEVVGVDAVERGCGISRVVCRNGCYIDSLKAEMEYSGLGFVDVDHCSRGLFSCSRFQALGLNKFAVRGDDASMVDLYCCWVDGCDTDAFTATDGTRAIVAHTGGDTASIAGYGMEIGAMSQVKIEGTVDLEGSLGKVRFTQSETTENYPAVKHAVADGQGSYVVA